MPGTAGIMANPSVLDQLRSAACTCSAGISSEHHAAHMHHSGSGALRMRRPFAATQAIQATAVCQMCCGGAAHSWSCCDRLRDGACKGLMRAAAAATA